MANNGISYPPIDPSSVPMSIGQYTVATLPPPAANQDKFAFVTDLFGAVRDKVTSILIGGVWYWIPTRQYSRLAPISTTTLATLSSPTNIVFNGTVLANTIVTLSPVNAYPGAGFDLGFDGTISVGSLTVAGLAGGVTSTLGVGSRKSYRYADNGDGTFSWRAF